MRQVNLPVDRGVVFQSEDWKALSQGVQDLMLAYGKSISNDNAAPARLTGVDVSVVGGTNYTITEGWLFYDNELFQVAAFAGSSASNIPVAAITTTNAAHEPHATNDGSSVVGTAVVNTIRTITWSFGLPGSGEFDYTAIEDNQIKKNLNIVETVFKTGMVMQWSGSMSEFDANGIGINNLVGWGLCDGRNGRPDLRGRFVVGRSDSNPPLGNTEANKVEYQTIGNIGGEAAHQLSESELPEITPAVNDPGHEHDNDAGETTRTGSDGPNVLTTGGGASGQGTQSATTGISIDSFGGDQAHENRPPYLTLAFIVKL